jgi:hypothetical protein
MLHFSFIGTLMQALLKAFGLDTLKWIILRWKNVTLLALGPPRAGKTTFLDYLRDRTLVIEGATAQTFKDKALHHVEIKIESATLSFRRPVDTPGMMQPRLQIELFKKWKPDCLVVVLNAGPPFDGGGSSVVWFQKFCEEFNSFAKARDSLEFFKRLRSFHVLLNKWDLISKDSTKRGLLLAHITRIVNNSLKDFPHCGALTEAIHVKPCSLVRTSSPDDELVKDVLVGISRDFTRSA